MPQLQTLGDLLGSVLYLGRCRCGTQHMSPNDRVLRVGSETLCARCAKEVQ